MVVAANDMGDAHLAIVDDRGKRIEEAAIATDQNRIGERGEIDALLSPHQVVPGHEPPFGGEGIAGEIRQKKTPMGLAPLPLQFRSLRLAEL